MSRHGSVRTNTGEIITGKIVSDGPDVGIAVAAATLGTVIAGPLVGLALMGGSSRTVKTPDEQTHTGRPFKG